VVAGVDMNIKLSVISIQPSAGPHESIGVRLACALLDSVTVGLRWLNRDWGSHYVTNDDPQEQRNTEAAGEFQCVYMESE